MGKLAGILKALDMSKAARMQRAAEQGFDPASRWYRGSASDEVAQSPGATFMAKDPNLANQYADQQGYTRDGSPNVAEMLTNASSPFDADALPRTITVDGFVNEVLAQARARGEVDRATMDRMFALRNKLKEGAKIEGSGPHYARHDMWYLAGDKFGGDGKAAIEELLGVGGFDSISMHENGSLTLGVLKDGGIRSTNAAFDPKNIGKNDLLGAVDTRMLAPVAAGGALAAFLQKRLSQGSEIARNALETAAVVGSGLAGGVVGTLSRAGGVINPFISAEETEAGARALEGGMMYQPTGPNSMLEALGTGVEYVTEGLNEAGDALNVQESIPYKAYEALPERGKLAVRTLSDLVL